MNTIETLLLIFGSVLVAGAGVSMTIRYFYWKDYEKRQDSARRLRGRVNE